MQFLHENWQVEHVHTLKGVFRKHRHVLLAPVFFVAVCMMLRSATIDTIAKTLPEVATQSGDVQDLGNGTQIAVTSASTYSAEPDAISLHQGSMLLRSKGMVNVSVSQSGSVLGWNGGLALLRSRTMLTVAALTTPAIVRFDEAVLLVPQGMQARISMEEATSTGVTTLSLLTSSLPDILPSQYLLEQQRRLAAFPIAAMSAYPQAVTLDAVLRGGDSHENAEQEYALLLSILEDDHATALELIRKDGFTVFSGDRGQQFLSTILSLEDSAALRTALLPFASGSDLRLLLAMHPQTREQGLLAVTSAVQGSDALLIELPLFDLAPDAIPEWISSRLTKQIVPTIARSSNPLIAAEQFFAILQLSLEHMRTHGYANRLQRYRALAEDVAEPYATLLNEKQQSLLGSVLTLRNPLPDVTKQASSASSTASRRLSSGEEASLTANIRSFLLSHGAMLTKDTTFSAPFEGVVVVKNIVFATSQGDQLFSFDFHTDSHTLSSIVRSGQKQSYGVALEEFLRWIAQ